MRYRSSPTKRRHKRRPLLWVVASLLLVATLLGFVFLWNDKATAPEPAQDQVATEETLLEPAAESTVPLRDLQPTIDTWVQQQAATYSVVVYDVANKQTIGTHLPDREYFAASLYKLFVAYLALIDFQDGTQNPNEVIIHGQTRKQCVDKMIRSSDSPCGEKMMADMTPAKLNQRVKDLGITHTRFDGIVTSAQDTVTILQLIADKTHLNEASTEFLRDAMLNQPQMYRNGLAKGAPNAKVYSKVGWNEHYNYHDVGIMRLPDGREYIVAILSQGNGRSAPLADFAKSMYAALN